MDVRTQDQIVTLPALREILPRVINHMVCANRSRRVHFPRAAHGSDFRPERFGNLDRKRTHATGRAINQNLLAWLDPSLITKTLKGGDCRHRYGCCVLKRMLAGFSANLSSGAHTYSANAPPENLFPSPEHFVAWFELRYVAANRFNSPRYINCRGSCCFGVRSPRDQSGEQRRTSHDVDKSSGFTDAA